MVEGKAEWGVDKHEHRAQLVIYQSPGGGGQGRTFSWRLPGCKQGQTEEFKVRLLVHRDLRQSFFSLSCNCHLCELERPRTSEL